MRQMGAKDKFERGDIMEMELIPRRCPYCHEKPDCTAYSNPVRGLDTYTISCNNELCMVQPMVQMYGKRAQITAVKFWNGEHPQNIYCGNCKYCRQTAGNCFVCNEHNNIIDYCLRDGSCAEWEPIPRDC